MGLQIHSFHAQTRPFVRHVLFLTWASDSNSGQYQNQVNLTWASTSTIYLHQKTTQTSILFKHELPVEPSQGLIHFCERVNWSGLVPICFLQPCLHSSPKVQKNRLNPQNSVFVWHQLCSDSLQFIHQGQLQSLINFCSTENQLSESFFDLDFNWGGHLESPPKNLICSVLLGLIAHLKQRTMVYWPSLKALCVSIQY